MTRFARVAMACNLAVAVAIGGRAASGQEVPRPPLPAGAAAQGGGAWQAELDPLLRRMGEQMKVLADLVTNDLPPIPMTKRRIDEANELGVSLEGLRMSLNDRPDRFEARRAYAGLTSSLQLLFSQLSQPDSTSPAIKAQLERIGESDARAHQLLGLDAYPVGYHGGTAPLSGVPELMRLTHALHDRAEALAAYLRADLSGPVGLRMIEEGTNLATATDTYHDALRLEGQIDITTKNGFAGVAAMSDTLAADLAQAPVTPRIRQAWQSYRSAEVLVRRTLGLPTNPDQLANSVLAQMPGGFSPVTDLAGRLIDQAADFIQVFRETAAAVPEGREFLADAQLLATEAANFRQDAARDLSPAQLAFEFRGLDAVWQRLARRTDRIARGRTGPNIEKIGQIGQTISEIHRLLAMPGYAPRFGPVR